MKRTIPLLLAGLFLIISLPLLVWGFWPPRRETRVVPLLPSNAGLSLNEARTIRLEWSPMMRDGDAQIVRLWLEPGAAYVADPLYDEYTVIAEARLELPFASVRPEKIISTPLVPGGSASFYWEVTPRESELSRGTVWLYLRFIPKGEGEEQRAVVSSQLVQINSRSMWMRTGTQARVVGVIGTLVALVMGIPFLRLSRILKK